ncbi:MAG: flagellin, partial [Pseudohongiellaceae bacterium]
SGTYTTTDQAALDLEFGELMSEIDRIATDTEWNGTAILSGAAATNTPAATVNSLDIQLGAEAAQTMNLSLNSWRTRVNTDTEMTAASGTKRDGVDPKVGEEQIVTFSAMLNGERFTLAGVTVVAGSGGVTAAHLEDFFTASTQATLASAPTNGTVSGALIGYDTEVGSDGTTTKFRNTGGRNDSVALASTHDGTGTDGTAKASVASVTSGQEGTENAGAYGTGVLHFTTSSYTRINVTSAANATQAISELDAAINGAAAERAKLGSYMSRLQHASDNLQNVSTNTSASLSRIADADYATETTELARTQIISQASTAMLAQANQVKQSVLSLLQ